MDLSIIIVSYNQLQLLERCIDSIYKWTKSIKFEVIVVDNDSKEVGIDSYLDSSSRSRDNFKFIKNRANHGFAAANNIGYRDSSGDFVVFLNPDTVLLNNSFKIMYDFLRENKDVAICGPRIFYPDKSFQVSFYSFPTLTKKFLKVMGVNKLLARSPNFLKALSRFRKLMPEYASMFNANFQEIGRPMEVPWVTGACLMIREDLFKKIDMFDENYKLYCEDMDLCLRVKENKFKIFFIPESKIIHHRGWMKRSFESLNFYFTSHAYYYKKNFRGIYKNMLLFLNKIEWSYERLFFLIKSKKR